jgi:hypothetical protein
MPQIRLAGCLRTPALLKLPLTRKNWGKICDIEGKNRANKFRQITYQNCQGTATMNSTASLWELPKTFFFKKSNVKK